MSAKRKPMSEINVVPYIDVMLVLLVIFMATASKPVPGIQDDPLVISLRADGALFLNIGLDQSDQSGSRVTIFSLSEQAGKILRERQELPVYVRADQKLAYGEVVKVMTVLQEAGAQSVGLITDPPDLK
jgi:biopolymer transport protein TolR